MSAYAVSSRGLAAHKVPQGVLATIMEMLYSNSEKGIAKLDFSDFTGMYQDRARTIPYTAVEQPLGSFTGLNGVTATAPADVNRGVVSARVNLLAKTRGASLLAYYTTTDNVIPPPTGVSTSTQIVATAAPASPSVQAIATSSTSIVASCYFHTTSTETIRTMLLRNTTISNNLAVVAVNLTTGAKTDGGVNSTVTYAGGGWYKLQINQSTGISVGDTLSLYLGRAAAEAPGVAWNIAGPSIVPADSAPLPHQWVDSSSSYDTAGFPHYLAFNGTNTAYATPSIDFTGTDKMTVWAGFINLGVGTSELYGLSTDPTSNPAVMLRPTGGGGASGDLAAYSRGSGPFSAAYAGGAGNPPATLLTTAESSISAPYVRLRINGTSGSQNTGGQGTGNYGNYPLYIGARAGGTSVFFNGRLYSLIVRGAQSSLSQIEAVETLIRQKMRLP